MGKTTRTALLCRMLYHVLRLVLSSNALRACFVSRSIRRAMFITLAFALLVQAGYFGSVLFLIWRSS